MKILRNWGLDRVIYGSNDFSQARTRIFLNVLSGLALTNGARFINFFLFISGSRFFIPNGLDIQYFEYVSYFALQVWILFYANRRSSTEQKNIYLVTACLSIALTGFLAVLSTFTIDMATFLQIEHPDQTFINYAAFIASILKSYFVSFIGLYMFPILAIILAIIAKAFLAKKNLHKESVARTTFGSAKFATKDDLAEMGAYNEKGSIFGVDADGNFLRHPICNRLIIAPPGSGKTVGQVIPSLLTEDRPILAHDIKGELFAVTARHRLEKFDRKIAVIDPFGVTKQESYAEGKPAELLTECTLNLLEYIPSDPAHRDRAITSLVSSMVISEAGAVHWEENAKILIGGLIDFALKNNPAPSLLDLHDYMMQGPKDMNAFLEGPMFQAGGRAQSAAAQILKSASEERGSIYTTTYRQIKWLADINLQKTFATSNIDLRDFVHGDMDIYVVMPEDQVKEQSRVIRMIVAAITTMLVQLDPKKLSKKKTLFIFDELGQLEYCEDIEKMIEILRARGVVLWAVFQDLSQVKCYKKPGLFLNLFMKQIFGVDDPETMKWLQDLGGTSTVLQENVSENKSTSVQESKMSSSNSKGEGSSYQETKVDLIHFNEIREMNANDQFVFIKGKKAIKCQKIIYYKEAVFEGMYDPNPLEIDRE